MCQRVPLIDSAAAAGEAPGGDVSWIVLEQVRLGIETAKDETSGLLLLEPVAFSFWPLVDLFALLSVHNVLPILTLATE